MRLKHHFFAWQYWTQWEWTSWLLGCDITKSIRHSHLKIYTFDFSDREWLLKTVSPCWTSLRPNTAMDFMTRLQRAAQTSNDDEVNNQLKSRQANIIVLAVGSYTVLIIQKTRDRTFLFHVWSGDAPRHRRMACLNCEFRRKCNVHSLIKFWVKSLRVQTDINSFWTKIFFSGHLLVWFEVSALIKKSKRRHQDEHASFLQVDDLIPYIAIVPISKRTAKSTGFCI